MREQKVSKTELARRMRVHEKEARRMLDPRHPTKVPTLERALAALGRRAEIAVSRLDALVIMLGQAGMRVK